MVNIKRVEKVIYNLDQSMVIIIHENKQYKLDSQIAQQY